MRSAGAGNMPACIWQSARRAIRGRKDEGSDFSRRQGHENQRGIVFTAEADGGDRGQPDSVAHYEDLFPLRV